MGFIYLITCIINNKKYVGQTTLTVQKRWNCHKSSAIFNKRYLDGDALSPHSKRGMCSKLYRAMNKYGHDNFIIQELLELDDSMLDMLECGFIWLYDSVIAGYNLKSGGDRSCHSDETKLLLKYKNSEHMKTTYVKFRKHEEINDLPMYCIYIHKKDRSHDTAGVAIYKHPKCPTRKEFTEFKYGTMEDAKLALLDYLEKLENNTIPVEKSTKKGNSLPKGVRKIKKGYFVDKTINGRTYQKAFSKCETDDENKKNAIDYLESLQKL